METKQQHVPEKAAARRHDLGSLLALGMAFGLVASLLLDDFGLGIALGLVVANIGNANEERRIGAAGAGKALVISLTGLIMVLLVWLLS